MPELAMLQAMNLFMSRLGWLGLRAACSSPQQSEGEPSDKERIDVIDFLTFTACLASVTMISLREGTKILNGQSVGVRRRGFCFKVSRGVSTIVVAR
jgi:hypothetical protein